MSPASVLVLFVMAAIFVMATIFVVSDPIFWWAWTCLPLWLQYRLVDLTMFREEHPENYHGPCLCRLCLSYADL
jgi:hypothetical protein